MSRKSLLKALKEGGRLLSLTVISYILTEGMLQLFIEGFLGTQVDVVSKAQIVGLLTTSLRTLDKYMHELGKEENNPYLIRGLTQF